MPAPSDPSRSGNALFLILIAVALFAALSYAVTRSGRGTGGLDKEQTELLAARIVQYSSAVSSVVQRMVLTGTAVADLDFTSDGPSGAAAVFAPDGGGIPFQQPPTGSEGTYSSGAFNNWKFKPTSDGGAAGYEMPSVGSTVAGHPAGDDIVMMAVNISADVCNAINRRLGESYDPPPAMVSNLMLGLFVVADDVSVSAGNCAGCVGKQFLCVRNPVGAPRYVFYHVLYQQ